MKKYRLIPTGIGLVLIVVGIIAGAVAVRQGSNWFLKAAPENTPKQIKVTNISDQGFTVSWITEELSSGFLKYGLENSLSFTATDNRDQEGDEYQSYHNHYFTLKNLKPSTTYHFKIGSEKKLYDNNGEPFQATTASSVSDSPPENDVAYGTILLPDGSPATGVIVYLSLAETTPLSDLTNSSGNWIVPLNLAQTNLLSGYTTYDKESSILEIFIQGNPNGTSAITATTRYDSPLPNVTLGENYDFRKPIAELPPETTETDSKFSTEEISVAPIKSDTLEITNPGDGEIIHTTKPNIIGKGPAGETLEITVESEPVTDSVIVDEDGEWEWNPPENLEPGEHKVTITYSDDQGLIHTLSRIFVVYASDTEEDLPAFEATPSASLTPYPTVSPYPTSSPTPTPTAAIDPTVTVTATTTPSPTPSPSLKLTATPAPSTESATLEPGNSLPTLLILLAGIGLTLMGASGHKFFNKSR